MTETSAALLHRHPPTCCAACSRGESTHASSVDGSFCSCRPRSTPRCGKCRRIIGSEEARWKCCPEHVIDQGLGVVCEGCANILHACHLPAPTAANGGALCVRRRGHLGPGLSCTSDLKQALARDEQDQLDFLMMTGEYSDEMVAARARTERIKSAQRQFRNAVRRVRR